MKVAIYGYGNLGKGVEIAVNNAPDMEVFGVFSRRSPKNVKTFGSPVYSANDISKYKGVIDVVIICGGSATDLPVMTPALAKDFCVIDSFDNHANIPTHFNAVDEVAKKAKTTALISCGWDPGMFSLLRVYSQAILPNGQDYTFWGRGVSQGHSDAIRRIEGVADARQYTVPVSDAVASVRAGENPILTTRMKHKRECYVVLKDGADAKKVENEIKTMPNYFEPYDTTVTFVSQEELNEKHKGLPHGGSVIRSGNTSENNKSVIEYSLKLDSNPEFTASVLTAYARAVVKLNKKGQYGCKTVFDVSPADLSPIDYEEIISHYL